MTRMKIDKKNLDVCLKCSHFWNDKWGGRFFWCSKERTNNWFGNKYFHTLNGYCKSSVPRDCENLDLHIMTNLNKDNEK